MDSADMGDARESDNLVEAGIYAISGSNAGVEARVGALKVSKEGLDKSSERAMGGSGVRVRVRAFAESCVRFLRG